VVVAFFCRFKFFGSWVTSRFRFGVDVEVVVGEVKGPAVGPLPFKRTGSMKQVSSMFEYVLANIILTNRYSKYLAGCGSASWLRSRRRGYKLPIDIVPPIQPIIPRHMALVAIVWTCEWQWWVKGLRDGLFSLNRGSGSRWSSRSVLPRPVFTDGGV
jgi:hypothetical protein